MGVLAVVGSSEAIQQGTRKTWTYAGGEVEERSYAGVASAISNLYTEYKAFAGSNPTYDAIEFDPGRGLGRLRVSIVGDGEAMYEMLACEFNKPIEQAPYFATTATVLTAAQIVTVYDFYEKRQAAEAGWNQKQKDLYDLLAKGTTEYLCSAYVLRKTENVSKRSSVSASYTGVNTKVDPPDTSAANSLIGALPTGEWLKKAPMVRQIGSRRWQIQQEWWWAEKWSAVLYGGTGTP